MTEAATSTPRRGGRMRIPRTRGVLSGVLLVVLGVWGALIPFIGPYFNYAYTPDTTWTWTTGRLWLEVVPGAAAALGGLILLMTAHRASAVFGGWLASAAGAWFVVGPIVSGFWGGDAADIGTPTGGNRRQIVEQLGFFAALGVVIVFLGAHAAGRVTVRSLRDLDAAEKHAARKAEAKEDRPFFTEETGRDDELRRHDHEGREHVIGGDERDTAVPGSGTTTSERSGAKPAPTPDLRTERGDSSSRGDSSGWGGSSSRGERD